MQRYLKNAVSCLVLALGAAACNTTRAEPEGLWVEDSVFAPSENLLWTATLQNLYRLGYPVGSQANPSEMTILTGWKTQLAPYRGKGYRQQADIRFVPIPPSESGDSEGSTRLGWDVEVRVKKQANMALVKPLDPSYAEWEWRPDDEWEAAILLRHILADFPPTDILEKPMN